MTRPDRSVLRRREFPALELPLSFTVLDEFRIVNDADKNWSKARPLEKQGQIADSSTMGLNKFQQLELVRLLLARKEDLDDVTVEDWFSDLLIATITLLASIFVFGNRQWPKLRYLPVAGSTITIGLCYTVFSEWLNIDVRAAWAYGDLMPVIPVLDVGLSPFAQWILLPILAFWFAGSKRGA